MGPLPIMHSIQFGKFVARWTLKGNGFTRTSYAGLTIGFREAQLFFEKCDASQQNPTLCMDRRARLNLLSDAT
jgi:hypothetical protein